MSCFLMINISFQSITHKRMMKRTSTKIERKAERICHTARMRKTTTAKTANVGGIPPKSVHTTNRLTWNAPPRTPRNRPTTTLLNFLCLVGGFTLLVSGGRYGRGENMQGFWWKIFNRPAGRIEKFSPKPVGREAGLQIFRGPCRSFAPWTTARWSHWQGDKMRKWQYGEKENWNTARFGAGCADWIN